MKHKFVHMAILTVVFFLGLSMFCEKEALARGRIPLPFIINTGDVIYPVAPIPDELAELSDMPDISFWKLGYKCQHFGIFYADIFCWDKELVIFNKDTYSEIPDEIRKDLETKYPFSDAERSAWNKYGKVVYILIAVILIVGGNVLKKKSDENPQDENEANDMRNENGQNEYAGFGANESDDTKCPKCGSERNPGAVECPKCGIIYEKYKKFAAKNRG